MIKPTDNKSAAPAINPSTNSFSPIFATIAITILDKVNSAAKSLKYQYPNGDPVKKSDQPNAFK